jgi:hypothetical protein
MVGAGSAAATVKGKNGPIAYVDTQDQIVLINADGSGRKVLVPSPGVGFQLSIAGSGAWSTGKDPELLFFKGTTGVCIDSGCGPIAGQNQSLYEVPETGGKPKLVISNLAAIKQAHIGGADIQSASWLDQSGTAAIVLSSDLYTQALPFPIFGLWMLYPSLNNLIIALPTPGFDVDATGTNGRVVFADGWENVIPDGEDWDGCGMDFSNGQRQCTYPVPEQCSNGPDGEVCSQTDGDYGDSFDINANLYSYDLATQQRQAVFQSFYPLINQLNYGPSVDPSPSPDSPALVQELGFGDTWNTTSVWAGPLHSSGYGSTVPIIRWAWSPDGKELARAAPPLLAIDSSSNPVGTPVGPIIAFDLALPNPQFFDSSRSVIAWAPATSPVKQAAPKLGPLRLEGSMIEQINVIRRAHGLMPVAGSLTLDTEAQREALTTARANTLGSGRLRPHLRFRATARHELLTTGLARSTDRVDIRNLLSKLLPGASRHRLPRTDPDGLLSKTTQLVSIAVHFVASHGTKTAFYALRTAAAPKTVAGLAKVQLKSDLAATVSAPATTNVASGGTVTDTITVTDKGPVATPFAKLTDAGSGTATGTVDSVTPSHGTCTKPTAAGGFSCLLGALTSGATATVTVTVSVPASSVAQTYTNTATVSGPLPDPASGNNSGHATTTLVGTADLGATVGGPADGQAGGGSINDVVTVANHGPETAPLVTVTDSGSGAPGETVSSVVPSQGSCTQPASDGSFVCSLGTIDSGSAATIAVTVGFPSSDGGDNYTNGAQVSGPSTDPNPRNNSGSWTTFLTTPVP